MSRRKKETKSKEKEGMDGWKKEKKVVLVGREKKVIFYLQGEWRRPMWRRWSKRRWWKLSMKLSRRNFFGCGFSSLWLQRPATPGGVTANLSANSFPRVDWPVGAFVTDTHTQHTRARSPPPRQIEEKKRIATIEEEKNGTTPNQIFPFFFLSRITRR